MPTELQRFQKINRLWREVQRLQRERRDGAKRVQLSREIRALQADARKRPG